MSKFFVSMSLIVLSSSSAGKEWLDLNAKISNTNSDWQTLGS